jgi:hypothetical protein
MKLIDTTTKIVLKKGDTVFSFRGERMTLTGWREPQHASSTGRVYVTEGDSKMSSEYFPGVIGAAFVEED